MRAIWHCKSSAQSSLGHSKTNPSNISQNLPATLRSLNAIQNVGQLVALPFCAWFCDSFGRRPGLLTGALILLFGVALQGGAQNTAMFIAGRGLLGFGLALNITAAPLLITELADPAQRAPLVSIYNSLWSLGSLVAAWTTYGTFRLGSEWAWRIPSLVQAAASVVQLALGWCVDESPRWLVSRGREAAARRLLVRYRANNGDDDEAAAARVAVEMEEIRTALRLARAARVETSYLEFARTPGNRRRFCIVLTVSFFSQWSGNGLISYYLTLVLDSIGYTAESTQTLINALLTLWSLFWGILFSLAVNRFGRRTLFLTSTAGLLLCYVVWTALEATYEMSANLGAGTGGPPGVAKGVVAMIFLYNMVFAIGWGPLQVTCEYLLRTVLDFSFSFPFFFVSSFFFSFLVLVGDGLRLSLKKTS